MPNLPLVDERRAVEDMEVSVLCRREARVICQHTHARADAQMLKCFFILDHECAVFL